MKRKGLLLSAFLWVSLIHGDLHPTRSCAEVVTQERLPARYYAGGDNTGCKSTQNARVFTGLNRDGAFAIGDLFTFQLTASPDFRRFRSYSGNYVSRLPWKHELSLYGGYGTLHPEIPHFRSEGSTSQASFRYGIPIRPLYTPLQHRFTFGFDYKRLNNNLFFTSDLAETDPVSVKASVVSQFFLGYLLQDTIGPHTVTLDAELYASPLQWFPDQMDVRYRELRPHSHTRYAYGRLALGDTYQLPHAMSLNILAKGQGATGPLLSSEQFGLGGYSSVRGYEERAFLADNGISANGEVHFLTHPARKWADLTLLAFVDYGYGTNGRTKGTGIPPSQYLLGMGPGLRLKKGTHLLIRADYGFQLHAIQDDDALGKLHLSGILNY